MEDEKARQICLPVTKHVDRFVPDVSQSDSLRDLPYYSEISPYLEKHYVRTSGSLEWKGINIDTDVFMPRDVEDCAYALIDQSMFGNASDSTKRPSISVLHALDVWASQNVSYGEPAPMGNATRLRTEFVDVKLRIWDRMKAIGPVFGWRELLNRTRVVFLGDPGSGKTTLLRNITLHETRRIEGSSWWRLPIYISLRQIGECSDLLALARATLDHQASSKATADFDLAFNAGRLLLILDGLDEVSDEARERWTQNIANLLLNYPSIGLYIGTRHWGYEKELPGFLYAKLQPFDQEQIQEWIQLRLARSNKDISRHLKSALTADSDLEKLASTPLTLSLIASVYERTGIIPRRKADLIARYLEAVLETWDSSRGVRRHKVNFLREDKIEALSLVAIAAWKESRLNFSQQDFCTIQQSWSPFRERVAAHRVLRDSGFLALTNKEDEVWSFTHELFRDYLVASYLVQSPDRISDWLANRDSDTKHLQLWRHACGISTDATQLFHALAAAPKMHSYEKALWLLAALCDGVNVPDKEVQSATKRIIDALESGIATRLISGIDTEKSLWRLAFRGAGSETQALSEMVKLIVGGGWQSSAWLVEPLRHAQSVLIHKLSTLLGGTWKIKSVADPDKKEIQILGSL